MIKRSLIGVLAKAAAFLGTARKPSKRSRERAKFLAKYGEFDPKCGRCGGNSWHHTGGCIPCYNKGVVTMFADRHNPPKTLYEAKET